MDVESESTKTPRRLTPVQVFLRGLAISLPPILTIVILTWLGRGVNSYIITPASATVRYVIAQFLDDSVPYSTADDRLVRLPNAPPLEFVDRDYLVTPRIKTSFEAMTGRHSNTGTDSSDGPEETTGRDTTVGEESKLSQLSTGSLTGAQLLDVMQGVEGKRREWLEVYAFSRDSQGSSRVYVPLGNRAVPYDDYYRVASRTPASAMATTATGLYMDYAAEEYFGSQFLLSAVAVMLIIVLLYFLGRFVNVRIGGWMVSKVENDLLGRLPVIRNVYGSTKQVTDFLFSENQVEYRRVVAIEYPRRGIWSLGLVTGESMLDITAAVGEPCVSVLVPSSPMPVTGYTMCLPRSAVLDLDITVDQAFQFCISCGVLVPQKQRVTPEVLRRELTRRLAERMRDAGTDRRPLPTLEVDSTPAPELRKPPESDRP